MTDVTRVPTQTISAQPPEAPVVGDLWWNSTIGVQFIYYDDGNTVQWVTTQPVKYLTIGELTGSAGGDLTGLYPSPTIKPNVSLTGIPTTTAPPPVDNTLRIATTQFVTAAFMGAVAGNAPAVVNVAGLKNLTTIKPPVVTMQGYNAVGDGGGGMLIWDPTSTLAPDDGLVFRTNEGPASGRYRRLFSGNTVHIRWWGGGTSGGAADDTAAWAKALATPYMIDVSGCVATIKTLLITAAFLSPGIFSDGSGVIVPAPGSTSADTGFNTQKATFTVDRITFNWPVAPYAISYPAGNHNRPLYMRWDTGYAKNWQVTNCNFIGGQNSVPMACGTSANAFFGSVAFAENNYFYQVYGDVLGAYNFIQVMFSRNIFVECGRDPSGAISSGNIRLNAFAAQTAVDRDYIIQDNICIDAQMGSLQEAIDISGNQLMGLRATGNILDNSGTGGFEIKTQLMTTPIIPDVYRDILIDSNLIRLNSSSATAISLHLSGTVPGPDVDKTKQVRIANNLITTNLDPPDGVVGGANGISCLGWSNVDIDSNTIFDVDIGIVLDARSVDLTVDRTVSRLSVRNNRVEARTVCVQWAAQNCDGLTILSNQLRTLTASPSLCISIAAAGAGTLNTGIVSNLRVLYNDCYSGYNVMELRGINGGKVMFNHFVAANQCIYLNISYSAGTVGSTTNTNTGVRIERNYLEAGAHCIQLSAALNTTIFDNSVNIGPLYRTWIAGTPGPDVTSLRVAHNVRGLLLAAAGDTIPPNQAGVPGDTYYNCVITAGGVWKYVCSNTGNLGGTVYKSIVNS